MSPVFDFAELRNEALRCTKCGFCQATCPSYRETRDESQVARGRIRLIRAVMDGELPVTAGYVRRIESCLYCLSCVSTCPSGVQIDKIILAAREHYTAVKGLPWVKRIALHQVLPANGRMSLASASLQAAQKTVLKLPLADRLVPKGIDIRRIPSTFRSLRRRLPAVNTVPDPRGRVVFYAGCLIEHTMPEIGESLVRVLNRLGVEVTLAKSARCCGLPMLVAGDTGAAKLLARRNIMLLEKMGGDAVVTACASCGTAIKKEYPLIFRDDPGMLAKAERLAARTFDISAYLVDELGFRSQDLASLELSVTYHDPCHLLRGQNVSAQPRALLGGLPGVEYREMAEAGRCCGAAGFFQALYPDVSVAVSDRKVQSIVETGAEYVASSCPACLQRIQGSLNLAGLKQKAVHVVQLLDQAGNMEELSKQGNKL
ncbi:MAG: (Fe-S)-binding protein [Dehalococcoidia bacterium]|nr:(Fe-S)-binding protein [Dehalococcoidia bacterium]